MPTIYYLTIGTALYYLLGGFSLVCKPRAIDGFFIESHGTIFLNYLSLSRRALFSDFQKLNVYALGGGNFKLTVHRRLLLLAVAPPTTAATRVPGPATVAPSLGRVAARTV